MQGVTVQEIKQHADMRGWVVWPIPESIITCGRLSNVHIPSLKPGVIRGNHYHRHTVEYALILSGPCRAVFADTATGEQEQMIFSAETPVLLRIAPGTAHAFRNEARHDIFLLCYDETLSGAATPDTHRHVILEAAATP